ncbi:MAG: hypothetical protein E7187_02340 [Erysipelotrichaceae bacterium]|nr:hypothetical protein [Erysipelotrichaceae bacterium]
MKKLITVFLTALMIFTLFGCGSKNNESNNKQGNNDAEPQNPQQDTERIEFKYGRVNNGVYENDIVGVGFRFDEYGLAEEPMGAYRDNKPAEEVARNMLGTLVVELYCKNKDYVDKDGNFIIFMQVTINVQESADKLEDYLKNNMDLALEQYNSGKDFYVGYTVNESRRFSGKIGGKDFEGVEFALHDSVNGTNIVERRYFARYGQYIYRITFMASDGDYASSFDQLKQEIERLISNYFYKL